MLAWIEDAVSTTFAAFVAAQKRAMLLRELARDRRTLEDMVLSLEELDGAMRQADRLEIERRAALRRDAAQGTLGPDHRGAGTLRQDPA